MIQIQNLALEDTSCLPSKSKLYTLDLKDVTRRLDEPNEEKWKKNQTTKWKGGSK